MYALSDKADALSTLGNYSEALKYYDKALSINPNYVIALSDKGYVLSDQGNYSEAIKLL